MFWIDKWPLATTNPFNPVGQYRYSCKQCRLRSDLFRVYTVWLLTTISVYCPVCDSKLARQIGCPQNLSLLVRVCSVLNNNFCKLSKMWCLTGWYYWYWKSIFLYAHLLTGIIMWTPAAGGQAVSTHVVCSTSQTVFIQSSPNLVCMLVGIMSRPCSITSPIARGTFW